MNTYRDILKQMHLETSGEVVEFKFKLKLKHISRLDNDRDTALHRA